MALPEIKVRVSAETGALDTGLNAATNSLNKFNKTSQQVASQLGGMTKATDAAAGATSNIAFQFQDIAMMMASGQSPFVLAMQQGTQLAGILNTMKNPIQGLGAAFLQVINPVSLVTIAAVGLGAAAVQAFMNTDSAAKETVTTLDGHLAYINKITGGYKVAQEAAKNLSDEINKLPKEVVIKLLGAEQKKAAEDQAQALRDLVAIGDKFIEQVNFYNDPSLLPQGLQNEIQAIQQMSAEAQSASPDLNKMLIVLNDLALNASDETIRAAAQEMYNAAKAAFELQGAAQASGAAMDEMARNALAMSKEFNSSLDRLSGLYMDQRSTYEQARAAAEDSYQSAIKAAGGEINRAKAAMEYKKVLDSINAAEAAAAAKQTTKTADDSAAKAQQLADRVMQLQTSLQGEVAVENAAYAEKLRLLAEFYDGKDALIAERQQYEALAAQQHADKLAQIDAATRMKQMQQQQMMVNNVTSIMGSISQIIGSEGDKQIGIQKAISSAIVAINTAQGVSKAFAEFGWPGGLLPAAAIAAQGAAQLAAINSASRNGGNVASPTTGGAGTATTAMNRTLTVQGITPGQIFSGDAMRDFMEQMLQMQRDGYQVVLA